MISEVAKKKALGLVGLGLRGRMAVVGVAQARDAAKHGKLKVALVANDASKNSLDKITGLLAAHDVPVINELTAAELGGMSGRESVAVIGVTDRGLAKGILDAIPSTDGVTGKDVRPVRPPNRRGSRR